MKKRMLITTIVMVLVVAIALTTSSLAWFTMSASVSISEVSFGAVAYEGADLSVAPYNRSAFGSSASIGDPVQFYPVQGDPSTFLSFNDDGYGKAAVLLSDNDLGFYSAREVESTVAGSGTKDQLIKLGDAFTDPQKTVEKQPVFIGGFNVRNNGTESTTAEIAAKLNVGTPVLINPNGSTVLDGDEYYVYGNAANLAGLTATAGEEKGDYKITGELTKADVQALFTPTLNDKALAGALKVAIFKRIWTATLTETTFNYTNGEKVHLGTYSFSSYNIRWNSTTGAWEEGTEVGLNHTNNLYVTTPDSGLYTMNPQLADVHSATLVKEDETDIAEYADHFEVVLDENEGNVINAFSAAGDNSPSEYKIPLAALSGADYSGVEITAIVWLDGWDTEAVPIAGGGRVSLSFDVKG